MFTKNKAFLIETLGLDSKTISNRMKSLIRRGFVLEDTKNKFFLHADLIEEFTTTAKPKYLRIYFAHCKELGFNFNRYALLYLMYSLARKNKNDGVFARTRYYVSTLGITERHFYKEKAELLNRNIISINSWRQIVLEEDMFEWFQNQDKPSTNGRIDNVRVQSDWL